MLAHSITGSAERMASKLGLQESHCRVGLLSESRPPWGPGQTQPVTSALIGFWQIKSCYHCCQSWESQMLLPSWLPEKLDSPGWLPHPTVHFSSLTSSPSVLCFKGLWSFLRRLLPDALHRVLWSFLAVLLPRMTLLLLSTHENLVTLKAILKFSCSRFHRTKSSLSFKF